MNKLRSVPIVFITAQSIAFLLSRRVTQFHISDTDVQIMYPNLDGLFENLFERY